MSQPIYCTAPECPAEADVILGMTANGDQTPLCFPHLYDWCGTFRETIDNAEIERTDEDAIARLADVRAPAQADTLDGILTGDEATARGIDTAEFPATAKVVRKHTSKSRRTYEARQAARAAKEAERAADEANAPLRGPDEPSGDPSHDA